MTEESTERTRHRLACKHYSLSSGGCFKRSHSGSGWSVEICCTPESHCERLRRYDKRQKHKQ